MLACPPPPPPRPPGAGKPAHAHARGPVGGPSSSPSARGLLLSLSSTDVRGRPGARKKRGRGGGGSGSAFVAFPSSPALATRDTLPPPFGRARVPPSSQPSIGVDPLPRSLPLSPPASPTAQQATEPEDETHVTGGAMRWRSRGGGRGKVEPGTDLLTEPLDVGLAQRLALLQLGDPSVDLERSRSTERGRRVEFGRGGRKPKGKGADRGGWKGRWPTGGEGRAGEMSFGGRGGQQQ